jgi:hypothetical protein
MMNKYIVESSIADSKNQRQTRLKEREAICCAVSRGYLVDRPRIAGRGWQTPVWSFAWPVDICTVHEKFHVRFVADRNFVGTAVRGQEGRSEHSVIGPRTCARPKE